MTIYKRLGDYIELVDERNSDNSISILLGINIDKYFMPSVANIVGTDLSKYKIVEKNQFACNRMHIGRDDRIPIAISQDDEDFIVSPAYDVFQVKNSKILLPEYLMMWFYRKEFDRNAWHHTDSDVRGGLSWEDFCDMKFPVPSIEKQREIVAEYNAVQNRIDLNNKMIQKLEETAQAIYREWFVEFNFPDENGKSYKDNGGEMVWNDEMEKEIPVGWRVGKLGDIVEANPETLTDKDHFDSIFYLDTGNITNNKVDNLQELNVNDDVIPSRARRKVKNNDIIFSTVRPSLKHYGMLRNPKANLIVSTGFSVLRVRDLSVFPELIYSFITDDNILEILQAKAEMSVSTYPSITTDDILGLHFCVPMEEILEPSRLFFKTQNEAIQLKNAQNQKLEELKEILLSRLANKEK